MTFLFQRLQSTCHSKRSAAAPTYWSPTPSDGCFPFRRGSNSQMIHLINLNPSLTCDAEMESIHLIKSEYRIFALRPQEKITWNLWATKCWNCNWNFWLTKSANWFCLSVPTSSSTFPAFLCKFKNEFVRIWCRLYVNLIKEFWFVLFHEQFS